MVFKWKFSGSTFAYIYVEFSENLTFRLREIIDKILTVQKLIMMQDKYIYHRRISDPFYIIPVLLLYRTLYHLVILFQTKVYIWILMPKLMIPFLFPQSYKPNVTLKPKFTILSLFLLPITSLAISEKDIVRISKTRALIFNKHFSTCT